MKLHPVVRFVAVTLCLLPCSLFAGDQGSPKPSVNYGRPFETPTRPAFIPLPPGAIEPTGWLRDWALVARDGFTGHMDEVSPEFKKAWAVDYNMTGDKLSYWDRGAWPYEGGGYWFDGLNRLAYALHDDALIAKVKSRFEPIIKNRSENGILFMWWLDKKNPKDVDAVEHNYGGEAQGWPVWANGLLGRALMGYYATSGDPEALKTLEMAYANSAVWSSGKFLPTGLWSALETYTWTGNPKIADALTSFFEKNRPLAPNRDIAIYNTLHNYLPDETLPAYVQPDHGVILNEGLNCWSSGYLWTGKKEFLDIPLKWYAAFEKGDGGMQPYGVNVGDENTGPTGSFQGTETCNIGGFMWSQVMLLRVTGEALMGDRLERAFFNAGPVAVTRDYNAHVYGQSPNRINNTNLPGGGLFTYQRNHWPLCCTAALNRILPNYLTTMWMATYDNGLAATCYGPCKVKALVGNRVPVELECKTDYPFNDVIDITVKLQKQTAFPLSFRIPGWCKSSQVLVNGAVQKSGASKSGFIRIDRRWKSGDVVRLRLPMVAQVKMGHDGDAQDTPYATVSLGPLLFSLGIPDTKDANTPDEKAKWNYALDAIENITLERTPMPTQWHWQLDSPLKLKVRMKSFDWKPIMRSIVPVGPKPTASASPFSRGAVQTILPADPVTSTSQSEIIELIPYGCTKFRISMFPVTNEVYRILLPTFLPRPYAK